jgi:hypothetical protein
MFEKVGMCKPSGPLHLEHKKKLGNNSNSESKIRTVFTHATIRRGMPFGTKTEDCKKAAFFILVVAWLSSGLT